MSIKSETIDLKSRVIWSESNGVKFLIMDFQYCTDEERIAISDIALETIKQQENKSVRLLVDVNNTTISIESMRAVNKDWEGAAIYLNRVAIIGVSGFKSLLLKIWGSMISFRTRPFPSKEEAIYYLCQSS